VDLTDDQLTEVNALYRKYLSATTRNYPENNPFMFSQILTNVKENLRENEDLYTHLVSVLEAMVYTSSNSVPDMIRRAEEDYERRYQEMTPEQQAICDQYRMKL
jgi:hypothetical protein